MIALSANDYYSDKKSKKVVRERKSAIIIGYFGTISTLIGYSFLVAYLIFSIDNSTWANIGYKVLLICSIFVVFWSLYIIFIKTQKKALRWGISLNNSTLNIYGEKIAISSILEAKIVEFIGSGICLAIGFTIEKTGKTNTAFHLLRVNDTKCMYELRDMIRKLKGWPEQIDIQKSNWSDWKKNIGKHETESEIDKKQ